MSNFLNELMNNNFYEKKASSSSKDDIKKSLNALSDDAITALADELDIFSKTAAPSIEEKITEKKADEKKEETKETSQESGTEEKKEAPKADEKKEEKNESAETKEEDKENKINEEKVVKTASEILEDYTNLGLQLEAQLEKDAYTKVGEMLKEAGFSTADYVYNLIGDADISVKIADAAEKIATESELPIIKVARDLVQEVINAIDEE